MNLFARRILLLVAGALALATPLAAREGAPQPFLIVHGAWGGAWQFAKVDPLLRERGYDVRRVTLTGLGERVHLASPDLGLQTHIDDVVNVILFENLRDIVLLGHSYGGMVISGVAQRVPDRIARLVYLDAILPNDGESLVTARGERPGSLDLAKMTRDGFLIPFWVRPDKPHPFDVPHPLKTFTDPVELKNPAAQKIPALYILTVEPGKQPEEDEFWPFAERARARGWPVVEMAGDHNPQWRQPAATVEVLAGALR